MPGTLYTLRNKQWQVPEFHCMEFFGKQSDICVCTPVINEGHRIHTLLERMRNLNLMDTFDVLIADLNIGQPGHDVVSGYDHHDAHNQHRDTNDACFWVKEFHHVRTVQ